MSVSSQQLQQLRTFYNSGATRTYDFRKQQLVKLQKAIRNHEAQLLDALQKDLHKSAAEGMLTEISFTLTEISYALKHLQGWMKPANVPSPFLSFPSSSKMLRDPWGVALIIAPWNYPVQLLLGPLVGAVAAGNCCVLKPSELAPATSVALKKLLEATFEPSFICVAEGDGAEVVPALINGFRFDHIFYTGGVVVGKEIAKMAAEQLIPTVLELGGKSPCVVDKDVDIDVAAKRIVWGKFINAGQTCVAPDYVLVHESRKEELVQLMQKNMQGFYGNDPKASPDYGRIINDKRFKKLVTYLSQGNVIEGGQYDVEDKYIAPTLMDGIAPEQPVMTEEIFGPILPIYTYKDHNEALTFIGRNPDPLAFYLFTKNNKVIAKYEEQLAFGGGCINNTLMHLANPELPFGGVATSGIGSYHGKFGFDTFTRNKSVLQTGTWIDPSMKYPPYTKKKMGLLKWFLD